VNGAADRDAGETAAAGTTTTTTTTAAAAAAAADAPPGGLQEHTEAGRDDGARRPPLLVAVVVAPDGEAQTVADARLAASRLARVGRRLQATWAEEEGKGVGGGG